MLCLQIPNFKYSITKGIAAMNSHDAQGSSCHLLRTTLLQMLPFTSTESEKQKPKIDYH